MRSHRSEQRVATPFEDAAIGEVSLDVNRAQAAGRCPVLSRGFPSLPTPRRAVPAIGNQPMLTAPTVDDLGKLPLCALIAYALRAARRLSPLLRGDPTGPIIGEALDLAEAVVSAESIADVDINGLLDATLRIIDALKAVNDNYDRHTAVFSAFNALRVAWEVVIAASRRILPSVASRLAVNAAGAVARSAELLDDPESARAIEAAHRDFAVLLARFGEQTQVIIGEAFELRALPWEESNAGRS